MRRPSFLFPLLLLSLPALAQVRRIDLYQGPIIGSSRVVGMGGAYISVAEGAAGHLLNPAAFAVRSAHTGHTWYDWDFLISILTLGNNADIDQSGRKGSFENAELTQGGGNLKFGKHGFGVHLSAQNYRFEESQEYSQNFGGLGYAYAFLEGALIVGGVASTGSAEMLQDGEVLARIQGGGLLIGALWGPFDQPWRLGAAFRSEIIGTQFEGDAERKGLVPGELVVPAEIGIGVSRMWGPRTYNPRHRYDNAPAPQTPRHYILAAVDLVITGTVKDAVSALAFLDGDTQASGEDPSVSLRAGVESEVWDDRLVVRGGSYFEPSRLDFTGRLHGTVGADVHIDLYWAWKISAVLDIAPGYINSGVGLGFWH